MSHLEICHLGMNINGFDSPIFGKKCYKGAGRFREFGNLQCRKGVRIYRLKW